MQHQWWKRKLSPNPRVDYYHTCGVRVVSDTIADPEKREAVAAAVVNGIGPRPADEDWIVWIHEPQERSGYLVTIEGAHGFLWERRFVSPHERTPEFIRETVFRATH